MPGLDTVWVGWQDVAQRALHGRVRWARRDECQDVEQEVALAMLRRRAAGAVDLRPAGLMATITQRIAGKHRRKKQGCRRRSMRIRLQATTRGWRTWRSRISSHGCQMPCAVSWSASSRATPCGRSPRPIGFRRRGSSVCGRRHNSCWHGRLESKSRRVEESKSRRARRGHRFPRILIQSGGSRAMKEWTRGTFALDA
jgi:hypothetical protein